MIQFFIIIPLAAAFIIPILGKRVKNFSETVAVVATFLVAVLPVKLILTMQNDYLPVIIYKVGNWMPPAGVDLVADWLSVFMLATINIVAFLVCLYSAGYMKKFTDTWKFYALFMTMLAGMNGVLLSGDIFNLYVFLEMAAISGYFLVAFGTEAEELEAAFKYAVMGTVASAFILIGIAFLYGHTSTLNMADMAVILAANGSGNAVLFVSVLFVMGFGLKAALIPFHAWLPYAHSSAPAPVSAMLSGVSIKVLGVYALTRILFSVFGAGQAILSTLVALGIASMVIGALLAFGQKDIKRLFAYSSISQIGYIALALGIGTGFSIFAALFHLFNHSIAKSLLFLNSGSIEKISGTKQLDGIHSIAAKSPVTGYTSLAGALSICGMPPFGGFWSKLLIILACIKAGHPVLALVAAFVGALTLAYYFRALSPALFGSGKKAAESESAPAGKISFVMAVPVVILAVISLVSVAFLLPNEANYLLKDAAAVVVNKMAYSVSIFEALK